MRCRSVEAATCEAVLDLAGSPLSLCTTSMGRLFDAVATLIGGRRRVSYEAQAAIELEALARAVPARRHLSTTRRWRSSTPMEGPCSIPPRSSPGWRTSVREGWRRLSSRQGFTRRSGGPAHPWPAAQAGARGLDTVALTGGVFQNLRLTEVVETELVAAGITVLVHREIPPNDGGISIGQAAVAAYRNRS